MWISATFQGESHTDRLNEGEAEMESSSSSSGGGVDIQQQLGQPDSSYRTQQAEASQSVSSCLGG